VIAILTMFEFNRQYSFSKEHEGKILGAIASEQDIQVELSTVQSPTGQLNVTEPTIRRNNNSNNTTTDNTATAVTNNNFSLLGDGETDITRRVRNAGDALYDSVLLSIGKAKRKSVEKAKEVVTRDINPAAIAAKKDAQDIDTLGDSVEGLARTFENLMTELRKQPYSEQVPFLKGYKKLLEEQINVVDSRIHMAKRLKSK
jgi:hypothetical protein